MQAITNMVYTTVFDYIAMTKDLIGCNSQINYESLADYANLIIQ